MLSRWKHNTLNIAVFVFCLGTWSVPVLANNSSLTYGGGPVGGTFNHFAKAMADFLNRTYPDIEVSFETSGGSTANLKRLNNREIDFGIVYSGDAYLGRNGRLAGDDTKYDNVRALGFLYGAPAHLVTRARDRYKSATDLAGKRVAVGNAGSGALTAAERFFKHLGLWDKIEKQFLGYSVAAAALNEGKLDAFWVFVGYPNASVIEAAAHEPIHLIDVGVDAEKSSFYEIYPFYQPMEIPAGTYRKQDKSVKSFQDAAYWCTNTSVSDELVYRSLKAIYSPDGLKHMVTAIKTANSMNLTDGIKGVSIPLHSGAEKFWKEKDLTVPDLE
jgi:TRAP transporter TAXI family solute receptor